MKNPFDYFDKIFCVNLDSRPDRWETVQEEFDKIGVLDKVERFSAITPSPIESIHTHGGGVISTGSNGCHLSHVSCIKYAKDNNFNNVLMFEDDVKFINWNPDTLTNATKSLNGIDWNMFYLGGSYAKLHKSDMVAKNLMNVFKPLCTQSYAVSKKGFDAILENGVIGYDFDNMELNIINEGKYRKYYNRNHPLVIVDAMYAQLIDKQYASYPILTIQGSSYSDIREIDADTEFNENYMTTSVPKFERRKYKEANADLF